MWAGDQNVDWSLSDGLASTITSALSMAMSGMTLTHFDIGGFTTFAQFQPPLVRSEELLLRSAEMAVFTPVFRSHEGKTYCHFGSLRMTPPLDFKNPILATKGLGLG